MIAVSVAWKVLFRLAHPLGRRWGTYFHTYITIIIVKKVMMLALVLVL